MSVYALDFSVLFAIFLLATLAYHYHMGRR